jgi:hypothetical protein
MYKPFLHAAAATLAIAALAPATASADWSAPTTIDPEVSANPVAQPQGVVTGWLQPTAKLAKRSGDSFGALTELDAADPFEKVWAAQLDAHGNAVVLTVRRHAPVQRVRAIFVSADGTRSATKTISAPGHSAGLPQLSVAPDGTAAAVWSWHDPAGRRAQAAIRRPGQPAFDAPQTVSPPAPVTQDFESRPTVDVAAGTEGRAVVSWQFGGSAEIPEAPLHVLTANTDARFGADQAFDSAGGYADTALAVGADGAVQLAWLDAHFAGHEGASRLHVAQGTAGAPLSAPAVLSTGGKGTSSGNQVAAAFSADGSATVAWSKPGDSDEQGGVLVVFTRPAAGAFGPAQPIADHTQGIELATGPGSQAALAWMVDTKNHYAIHTAVRPQAGGPFGADTTISDTSVNGLWPTVAIAPDGAAIATWVTNSDGSGAGKVTAAVET